MSDHAQVLEDAIKWLHDHSAAVNFTHDSVAIVYRSQRTLVMMVSGPTLLEALERAKAHENVSGLRPRKDSGGSHMRV